MSGEKDSIILENIIKHLDSWKHTTLDQVNITRLAGLSNACYRVKHQDKELKLHTVLYRKFECLVVDKEIEAMIFKSMSDQNLGPKLIAYTPTYRIEEFKEGRPLSIWEMTNKTMIGYVMRSLCDFNFNRDAREKMPKMDASKLVLDQCIDEWCPAVKARLPKIRGRLLTDNGIPHPRLLEGIDALDRAYLFEGHQEYFRSLVPRDRIVLSHNDA